PIFALSPKIPLKWTTLEQWEDLNGYPGGTTYCIYQSRNGYLWFGTEKGLLRYDGKEFYQYNNRTEPAFRVNDVAEITETPDGSLWVATMDGLLRYRKGKFTRYETEDGLPHHDVRQLLVDRKGILWVGTRSGLCRLRENHFETVGISDTDPKSPIYDLIEQSGNGMWVVTGEGLFLWSDGHAVSIQGEKPGFFPTCVWPGSDGSLWIGTISGVFHLPKKGWYAKFVPDFGSRRINSIYMDSTSALWVATERQGIYRQWNGSTEKMEEKDGLLSSNLTSIIEDREGSIWIGSVQGLGRFRDTPFTSLGKKDGLPDSSMFCVAATGDGSVWAGTSNGLAWVQPNGTVQTVLSGKVIFSLYPMPGNELLVGTESSGLLHLTWHSGRVDVQSLVSGIRKIYAVEKGKDGTLWIGTLYGLYKLKTGKPVLFGESAGLGKVAVRCILRVKDIIWAGTSDGLYQIKGDEIRVFHRKDGLASNFVFCLLPGLDGTLWIGTDQGLSRFQSGTFTSIGLGQGLPSDSVYQIVPDENGRFWMNTADGIALKSRKKLNQMMETGKKGNFRLFGKADGLPDREGMGGTQPTGCRDTAGRLWFPTPKGLAVVNPNRIPKNTVPPPVVVEEARVDDQPMAVSEPLQLKPGWKRLSVNYAGLSYLIPSRNRYRVMLEGFDNGFETTKKTEVEYTNLDPGDYQFMVYAANNDGVWSKEPAVFNFTVLTPWWRTLWFLAFLLVFTGVMMNLLTRGTLRILSLVKQWRSTHVFGKYRILEAVGRGGMGTVYKAVSKKSDRLVALKVLDSDISDKDAEKRFLREGKLGQEMDHPNIVRIYNSGKEGNRLFYAMELCQGTSLRDWMEKGLSIRAVLSIAVVLCDALYYLHEKGIVHRDVKPENIIILAKPDFQLVDEAKNPIEIARSCVKLLDLGLARLTGATTLTRTGLVAGTIMYVPPESLGGNKHASSAVDYYAVGIMMYETITGIGPYTGEDMADLMYAILYRSPAAPASVEPRVPKPVSDFVMRIIEKDAKLRLTDYLEIREGLLNLLDQF
ncbi:MAG: protein kinase, partial [Acidobacteria bacterium]|nr:protein kinase [Acidobacteriota bacterium]